MYQRIKPALHFAAELTVIAVLVLGALSFVIELPAQPPVEWGTLLDADGRVGALLDRPREPFCLYVGQSTALSDLDPQLIDQNDDRNCRSIVFWGNGGSIEETRQLAAGLL